MLNDQNKALVFWLTSSIGAILLPLVDILTPGQGLIVK